LKRFDVFWAACGAAFVLLVIYLSVTPDPLRAPTVGHFKTGHIIAYTWCMLWFAQVWRRWRERAVIAIGLVALGVGLEYVQDLLPWHRDFAVSDMVDDAIGVGLGLVLAVTPLGHLEEKLSSWF
jgi:VanZ family protein